MDADLQALRVSCARALVAHGPVRPTELLASIPTDTAVDKYGRAGWSRSSRRRSRSCSAPRPRSTCPDAFRTAVHAIAVEQSLWTWARSTPTGDPAVQRVELPVGDATLAPSPEQVRDVVARLVGAA